MERTKNDEMPLGSLREAEMCSRVSWRFVITWINMILYGTMLGIETVQVAVFTGNPNFDDMYDAQDSMRKGIMTASFPCFAMIGSVIGVLACSAFQKKHVIVISTFGWLSGYLVGALLHTFAHFLLGRFLKGVSLGLISGIMPFYIREVFPGIHSQYVLISVQSAIPFGICLTSLMATAIAQDTIEFHHRWLLVGAVVVPAALFAPFIRSSPDDKHKLSTKAGFRKSLNEMYGPMSSIDCERVNNRYNDVAPNLFPTMKKLFSKHRSTLLCAIGVQLLVQLTGINVIVFYVNTICRMAGQTAEAAKITALALYCTNFVVTGIAIFIIERCDKTILLRMGCILAGGIHCAIFALLQTSRELSTESGTAILVLCFCFVTVFGLLISGSSIVYTCELLPDEVNGVGVGVAICAGWLCNFALAAFGPLMLAQIGHFVFLLFSILCFVGCLALTTWVMLVVKKPTSETKPKSCPSRSEPGFPDVREPDLVTSRGVMLYRDVAESSASFGKPATEPKDDMTEPNDAESEVDITEQVDMSKGLNMGGVLDVGFEKRRSASLPVYLYKDSETS